MVPASTSFVSRSIQSMATDLDLMTVAEGVETPAQHAYLRDIGCHLFQGWLFGRPKPIEDLNQSTRRTAA